MPGPGIIKPLSKYRSIAALRDRRAAAAARSDTLSRRGKAIAATRARRGSRSLIPSDWRRGVAGTNRISCLGMWKTGTRRQARRANRCGETDWQRPYQAAAAAQVDRTQLRPWGDVS